MQRVTLDLIDAVELAELLGLIRHWLACDQARLALSLEEFIGNPAYGVRDLRSDLARFEFLLGGDSCEEQLLTAGPRISAQGIPHPSGSHMRGSSRSFRPFIRHGPGPCGMLANMGDADDADDTAEPGAGVHNEITGGCVGDVVQAGVVGEVHLHGPQDGYRIGDDPLIATVERKPHPGHLAPMTVTVDDDPPREMMRAGSVYSILVEARTTWAVTLRAMRAVVVARRSPRRACIEPVRIGAILPPRPFTADFDTDPPRLTALEADFPFTVSATDVEQFDIMPKVSTDEVSWFLEIDWTCQEHSGTTVVSDGGAPFEIYPASVLFGPGCSALNWGCNNLANGGHVPGCPTERLVALRRAGAVPAPDPGVAKAELEDEFPDWRIWRSDAGRWYATHRQPSAGGTVGADSPNGLRILLHKRSSGCGKA